MEAILAAGEPGTLLVRGGDMRRSSRWAAGGAAAIVVACAVGTALLRPSGSSENDALLTPRRVTSTAAPTPASTEVPAATTPSRQPEPSPSIASTNLPAPNPGVPGRVIGVVSDAGGRPLDGIRILSGDLDQELGRTSADGSFSVPCHPSGLVYAPYAFVPHVDGAASPEPEPSPGRGNYAFRVRGPEDCGRWITVTLPAGGVVEGEADRRGGTQIRLSRVVDGKDADGTARFGTFVTTARSDGTYRIEGLATGRYSIDTSYEGFADEATFLDVHEGRTTDGSYSVYLDPANCVEPDGDGFVSNGSCDSPPPQWPDTPTPEPSTTS